jgi:hypothetical protein
MNSKDKSVERSKAGALDLGAWLGRHQAFGMIASRCSAADAECLKTIRDRELYKELGLTWRQFLAKYVGASRTYVEKQIHCWEEFGPNYHRFVEAMPLSPETYRLLQSSVTDDGLQHNGEVIPLTRENRAKLAAVVKEKRAAAKPTAPGPPMSGVQECMQALIQEVRGLSSVPDRRVDLIMFLERGSSELKQMAAALRQVSV